MNGRDIRTRIRTRVRGDSGFSLVEVVVTMTLMLSVSGAILGVFDVFGKAHSRQESTLQARQSLRLAIDQLAEDARRGSTLVVDDVARARWDLGVVSRDSSGAPSTVRYLGDLSSGALTRVSATEGKRSLLNGLFDGGSIFRYFDSRGNELDPKSLDPKQLAVCTSTIRVQLWVRPSDAQDAISASTSVSMRNRDRTLPC